MELRAPQVGLDVFAGDVHRSYHLAGFDLGCDFAQQAAELSLEVAHAGFARVVRDDPAQGLVIDGHLIGTETVALELAAQQVVAGDRELLFLGVAVQPDDLHPVEQRHRDGVRHVRRRDKQDFGQIQVDLEVVITERMVLRRVEHLEQGR